MLLSLLSTQCTLGQNNPAPGSVRQTPNRVGGVLKFNVLKFGFFLVKGIKVLYMSFDKFLLAVESRDISQADKSNIRVSSFPKLCDR